MTPLLLGIQARGGVAHVATVEAPNHMQGDGAKTDTIVWYSKADGSLWADYERNLLHLAERRERDESTEDAISELAAAHYKREQANPLKDLTGDAVGGWTVLRLITSGSFYGSSVWECQHKCGNVCCWRGNTITYGKAPKCRKCGER
jgi:hypothetical protein